MLRKHFLLGIDAVMSDKKFMSERGNKEPVWTTLTTYLDLRQSMLNLMNSQGVSSFDPHALPGSRHEQLALAWTARINQLRRDDSTFNSLYSRFMDNDDLSSNNDGSDHHAPAVRKAA